MNSGTYIQKEVKVFRQQWECPKCHAGFMIDTGDMFYTNPLQYIHSCDNCKFVAVNRDQFPRIIYEEIMK